MPDTHTPAAPMSEAECAAFYAPPLVTALAAFPPPWSSDGIEAVSDTTGDALLISSAMVDDSGHTPTLLLLAAASPDLLSALRRLLSHYVRVVSADGTWDPEADPEVLAARAVLARVGAAAS